MATLATVRASVRNRLRISANDPMFPDATVNRQINIAYAKLSGLQPNGWWWQHVEETVRNGSSDTDTFQVRLATADNTRLIRKVESVFVSADSNYWLPVDQRERQDQIRLAGGRRAADGIPLSWSVLPKAQTVSAVKSSVAIIFEPLLPALYYVRFIASVENPDLTGDGSVLGWIPTMLVGAVVELAVAALARQKRDRAGGSRRGAAAELLVAQQAADEWVKCARVYFAAPAAGAGYTTIRARP